MLGNILFLGMMGISGLLGLRDNQDIKKKSLKYDKDMNLHYIDRFGEEYINGEKIKHIIEYDDNGNRHNYSVGIRSNKNYNDLFDNRIEQINNRNEEEKKKKLQYGYLAYNKYDLYFKEYVTTEIKTGKVITCLYSGFNEKTHKKEYRKWYFQYDKQERKDYRKTLNGDYGIIISKEEYEKLDISGKTCSGLPSDNEVLNILFGCNTF